MSGRVCASILQRASSYTLPPSSSVLERVHLVAVPSSQPPRPASLRRLSSTCRPDQLRSSGDEASRSWSQRGRHFSTSEDLDFQLNLMQINSILRSNEQIVSVPEFDGRGLSGVRKFESNQLAANKPNEDRRSAATCLQSKGMLFGVFDGHGGWACAQAVSERLLYYVAVAMMPKKSLEELERCMEHGRPVPPILQWYKHHADLNYRESASLYINHLRVFWQELLDSEEHGEGMKCWPTQCCQNSFNAPWD